MLVLMEWEELVGWSLEQLLRAKIKISVEAASTGCWKKYVGKDGLSFGIDTFGKSAPYKEIYKYFGLTSSNIASKLKKMVRKTIWL